MRIGIVGAGMAGLACGESLTGQGHDILLFDKGPGRPPEATPMSASPA